MPTESTFFLAGLLFLAAALGYVFARFGDPDDEAEDQDRARATFLKGFRYLLNEEPDRAVEAFTTSVDISDEVVETQIALGSLFRRRGELDRAIRLHQNLVDRGGLNRQQRDGALFALGEDYLGAGLFDRAEEIFLRLRDSPYHRTAALQRLLRICEVTQDWDRAIDLCGDLRRADSGSVEPLQLGHYYCELADRARRAGDPAEAAASVAQADSLVPGLARAVLIAGDLAADSGDHRGAGERYWSLLQAEPELVSEILPRLSSIGALGQDAAASLAMAAQDDAGLRRLVAALVATSGIDPGVRWPFLSRYVAADPVLAALLDPRDLSATEVQGRAALERVAAAVQALLKATPRYHCGNCGYQSITLQWQCPGCRRWDTVRATDRILPAPAVVPRG